MITVTGKEKGERTMEYISVKAAADKYGVTTRWIQKLCEDGKIEGAMKLEGSGIWLIPKEAAIVLERKNRGTGAERVLGR